MVVLGAIARRDSVQLSIRRRGRTSGIESAVKPRGEEMFGWDPWFQPRGSNKTFAEMTPEEKDQVSHRGRAYRQLAEHLRAENARSAGRR